MTYFTKHFIDFFSELEKNNSKVWFDEHRSDYEKHVKKPFGLFVEALITNANKEDNSIQIEPKNAISRINRDIRFSKDKTPYNTHLSAIISRYGRKSMEFPGIYVELSPKAVGIYGGAYAPEKDSLLRLRQKIARDAKGFRKVIEAKKFKDLFGEIKGEKNKVVPKEFSEFVDGEPLILNKQFYFVATLPAKIICSEELMPSIMTHFKVARPVNDFLTSAMGLA